MPMSAFLFLHVRRFVSRSLLVAFCVFVSVVCYNDVLIVFVQFISSMFFGGRVMLFSRVVALDES